MSLTTFEIPQKKMLLVNGSGRVNGSSEKSIATTVGSNYAQNHMDARQNIHTSYFSPSKGWEFFSNELEFE